MAAQRTVAIGEKNIHMLATLDVHHDESRAVGTTTMPLIRGKRKYKGVFAVLFG